MKNIMRVTAVAAGVGIASVFGMGMASAAVAPAEYSSSVSIFGQTHDAGKVTVDGNKIAATSPGFGGVDTGSIGINPTQSGTIVDSKNGGSWVFDSAPFIKYDVAANDGGYAGKIKLGGGNVWFDIGGFSMKEKPLT